MFWIVFSIVLVFFSFNILCNYYHFKWDYLLFCFSLTLSYFFYEQSNIFVALFLFYCLCSSGYIGHVTHNFHFAHPKPGTGINSPLSVVGLKAFLALTSLIFLYTVATKEIVFCMTESIRYMCIIGGIWTLIPYKYLQFKNLLGSKSGIRGFGANMSVDATLLSLMAPFLFINFEQHLIVNYCALGLIALALLKNRCASGTISFAVSTFTFFLFYTDFNLYYIGSNLLALVGGLIYLSVKTGGSSFFDLSSNSFIGLSGRDEIWLYLWKRIFPMTSKWFGTGIGSYQVIMPAVQARHPMKAFPKHRKVVWAHNDILQLLCEGGIIGIVLMLVAYGSVAYMVISTGNLVAGVFIVSYSINSFANFAHHMAPDSFLMFLMLKYLYY